jgi:hypothetical protein
MKRAAFVMLSVAVASLAQFAFAQTTRPGVSPREAEQVRAWGLAHGWLEVAPQVSTQPQDEESAESRLPADQLAAAQKPYEPTGADRTVGFVAFSPDRNQFRLRDAAPSIGEKARRFRAAGFPGEFESLPIMVHALRDIGPVSVSVTDQKLGAGETLSAADVSIRELIYAPLSTRNTRAKQNKFQMWPMWLVPQQPAPLPAGQGRQFWLTIRCPEKPGVYSLTVMIGTTWPGEKGQPDVPAIESMPVELTVLPIKLDASLCSWAPVTAGQGFDLALYQQFAEHHMTGLSWWWGDWGLRVRKEIAAGQPRATLDFTSLDQLNAVTKATGMRGPWILFLGNMIRGHLELRLAGRYREGVEQPLFDVKITTIQPTGKSGVQPSKDPAVADLSDSAEMDKRYVEVLQSLGRHAKEQGYPQIIVCPYDEPTKYLAKHNAHWCELIRKNVPEIKVLNTPQGYLPWAKNLLPYSDYIDVQGGSDPIYEAAVEAGVKPLGYSRLTANQTFAQARFDMGLRFARQQPNVIYFWSLNYGHGYAGTPFNDLIEGDSAARHQFAWPPAAPGGRWVETIVWEAQREGAKDYLLTLMVQRELDAKKSPAAEGIRPLFDKFKADASVKPGDLDARREQLVKWYGELTK